MIDKISTEAISIISKLKFSNSSMDYEGFILASGFALLIVLLGWADQITSKSKELKDIETAFLEKAEKLKKSDYKDILDKKGSTESSFTALVNFLYSNKEEEVELFEKIKYIKEDIKKLDYKYNFRFWLLLYTCVSLFATGIISLFLPKDYKLLSISPNIMFISVIFFNLISVYVLEKRCTQNIAEAMEKL